jgi:uncharacterized protein (TIGR00730 family)
MKRLCVYAGSSLGGDSRYTRLAAELGGACARRGISVVYGGGGVGLMGALADAALAAGGEVIGVIPRAMMDEERGHREVTQLILVSTMHERKQQMAELSDAFVALPGGIGTLEEVVEVFTWLQLGLHLKPVGLLNAFGFYDRLLDFFAHLRDEGFVTREHHEKLTVADQAEEIIEKLAATRHTRIIKPIHRVPDLA